MNYEYVTSHMNADKFYTRKQIFDLISNNKTDFSNNSLKWIISDMKKNGIINNVQRGVYSLANANDKSLENYIPNLSSDLNEICKLIDNNFPLVEYICFESIQLNEFLNHLIASNTFVIYVEKGISSTVFRYLKEKEKYNILYKPSIKEFDLYWKEKTIIVLDLVSEFPKNKNIKHVMSIEHLLVDLISEKSVMYLYSQSEIENIYKISNKTYNIDYSRLYRYARRRNKEEKVKEIMKGVIDVNK